MIISFQQVCYTIIPLLFLQREELPFCFLLAETKFFSVSLAWVALEDFGELAYLFHPFSVFWREKGTRRLGGLRF